MRRYDRAWERGYGPPGRVPYDSIYRSGDAGLRGARPGRSGRRGGPGYAGYHGTGVYGGYDRFAGGGGYDRIAGHGGYDRLGGGGLGGASGAGWRYGPGGGERWARGYDRGYDDDYPPHRGSHRRETRSPRGYGSWWGRGYGPMEGLRRPSEPGRAPRQGRGGEWTEWVGYSEEWEFPEGYVDEGIEEFFVGEDDGAAPWELDEGEWDDSFEDPLPEPPDDDAIRQAVIRSLRSDGFLDAEAIRVEVKDAVVTLRGKVGDYMESRYAWDDAWDAPGVEGVISKLTVREVATPQPEPAEPASGDGEGGGVGRAAGQKRASK